MAAAHGEAEYSTLLGDISVETFDEVVPGMGILYTIVLSDAELGLPVVGATVEVRATGESMLFGPLVANEFSGAYQVLIEDPEPQTWSIEVSISRPTGEMLTFAHEVSIAEPGGGTGTYSGVAPIIATLLLGLAAVALLLRRRRLVG